MKTEGMGEDHVATRHERVEFPPQIGFMLDRWTNGPNVVQHVGSCHQP